MKVQRVYLGRLAMALLMAIITVPLWATGPGKVSLNLKNATLHEVFQQLKQQTDYKFIYSDRELDSAPPVTVRLTHVGLDEALKAVLKMQAFTYEINDKVVVIKPLRTVIHQVGQNVVSGKIVDDANGEPLVGVSVIDPVSKKGGITAVDGTFVVEVSAQCDRVLTTYIGYESKEMMLKDGRPLVIALAESDNKLDEVVVIGYGSAHRKDLTGSVVSVKADELRTLPSVSVDDALTGKAAGVQVIRADGSPGGAVRIRVRGGSSLSGSTDPLYIIDGVPTEVTDNYIASTELVNPMEAANYGEDFNSSISGSFARGLNNLAGLNIADIESINILKDASATAIYGSKAANGVVIITTKSGRRETKPQFNFNYSMGISNPVKEQVLNTVQYKQALTAAAQTTIDNINENAKTADQYPLGMYFGFFAPSGISDAEKILNTVKGLGNDNTDWMDMILRTGVAHNVDFSVSGGGQTSRYYTSLSYSQQDGTLIGTDFERYSGKVRVDNDITQRFRMSTNINLGYTKNNITNGLYAQALSAPPVLKPYNEDGTYASMGALGDSYMGFQNPMAVASCLNEAKTYMLKGSVSAEIDLLKDLKFKSTASVDYNNYNQLNYIPSYVKTGSYYGAQDSGGGSGTQAQSTTIGVFFENTLSYNKTFNKDHRLDALVGTSWEDRQVNFFSATGKGYPDDQFLNNLSSAQTAAQVKGANPLTRNSLLSFYARFNYVWKDRYLFTFTGRSDASSKFAPDNRVGYFPSGAIAWRLSEESFLKDASWIDELKLRASIGKTGTQDIADYMWRTLYSPGAYGGKSAMFPSQLGNNNIRWESTVQRDLGLDFSFFNGRLGGTLGYYHKITDGALLNVTPAPSSGFSTVVYNIAKIRNSGLEVELYGDFVRNRNWKWSGSLNVSHNVSKILHIDGDFSDASHRELNLGTSLVREGEPLGLLCGYKAVGIIKTQEQLDDYKSRFEMWPMSAYAIGIGSVELALDEQGNYYQDIIGNSTPDFFGGYTNTLTYKNWSLMTLFTFSYGNDLIYQKDVTDASMNSLANRGTTVMDASSSKQLTDRPLSSYKGDVNFLTYLNVYDASYLKLKSLSLSYALPSRYAKRFGLNNLSVYATATNLFTLTKYPGADPEVSDAPRSIAGGGRDISSYPTSRSYMFGVRFGF